MTTKHDVLQRCWVHVLPSRKEGWGLAVIEAAQHAVPTIGYRSSGGLTDSIVDGVTGLLVDDHAELVDRLEQLLSDDVLREELGTKAQIRSGEFSWPQSADAMRSVLESVPPAAASAAWSEQPPTRPVIANPTAPPSSIASHTRCVAINDARGATRRRWSRRPGRASGPRRDTPRAAQESCGGAHVAGVPVSTTTQPTPAARADSRVGACQQQPLHARGRASPSPGTVVPQIIRSPVVSTSARTQRGSGSSTGAGPAQANRRMLSAGSTATGRRVGVDHRRRGRPALRVVHRRRPCPPTPQARSGSDRHQRHAADRRRDTGPQPASQRHDRARARQRVAGQRQRHPLLRVPQHARGRARRRRTALQRGQTRAGRHSGGDHHRDAARQQQQRRARNAMTATASPTATSTASSTTAATTAKSVVREAVPPQPFQMPPRPARLPSVPRPGSARAANAARPAGPAWSDEEEPGDRRARPATAAPPGPRRPSSTAAHTPARVDPRPGSADADQRDDGREHQPRRRQAGQRDPEHQAEQCPATTSRRCAAQHRGRHPRQAAVADQQTPVALQESFGDIGIPDRERRRDELAGRSGSGTTIAASRAAPQPATHSPTTSSTLTTTPPSTKCDATATAKSCGRPGAPPRSARARRRTGRTAASTPRREAADSPGASSGAVTAA